MATVGWTQDRTDEVLVPVIRDMNQKQVEGTQSNITHYFEGGTGAGAFAPRKRGEGKSKRMEKAMVSLHEQALRKRRGGWVEEAGANGDDGVGEVEMMEPKRKRAKRSKPRAKRKARETTEEDEEDGYRDEVEDAVVETVVKRRSTGGRKRARKN